MPLPACSSSLRSQRAYIPACGYVPSPSYPAPYTDKRGIPVQLPLRTPAVPYTGRCTAVTAHDVADHSMLHHTEIHLLINLLREFFYQRIPVPYQRAALYDIGSNSADSITGMVFLCMFILYDQVVSFQTCKYPMGRASRNFKLICKLRNDIPSIFRLKISSAFNADQPVA